MYARYIKRLMSFAIGVAAFPFFLVILVVVSPLIYFDDPGPVFYRSTRVGKNGKLFSMYKFRSMKVGAPNLLNPDGSTFNSADDTRQTRVGKILRKTSIDETPQLINIIKGEMDVIGPRPVLDFQLDSFTEEEKGKLAVLPGLTGYSQAYCRNELTSHEERMQDAWYAKNVSFLLDLKIFFKTIDTVLHPNRVYRNEGLGLDCAVSDDSGKED